MLRRKTLQSCSALLIHHIIHTQSTRRPLALTCARGSCRPAPVLLAPDGASALVARVAPVHRLGAELRPARRVRHTSVEHRRRQPAVDYCVDTKQQSITDSLCIRRKNEPSGFGNPRSATTWKFRLAFLTWLLRCRVHLLMGTHEGSGPLSCPFSWQSRRAFPRSS